MKNKCFLKWIHWSYRPKSLVTYILLVFIVILLIRLFPKIGINFGHTDSKQGVGLRFSNTKNQWHYQFYYLQGQVYGSFKAKTDNAQLFYSTDIEQGTITFELYNKADSLLTTFPTGNVTDTIGGFIRGEKYWIKAIAKGAKGRFDMEMK